MRNLADGMMGAIIASESLGLTDTMINGAGGCRSRAQIMMHDLIPSYYPENRGCCRSKCFSRQSRLPCTYLNNDDIVFGIAPKVSDSIESVSSITGRRTVLLDTLGASLLCTDYSGLTGRNSADPIFIEEDLPSLSLAEGYDAVTCAILEAIEMESGRNGSVNILGYGLMDLGWEAGADELCHLLELMGIEVNCVLGCIPSPEDIRRCGRASLNIMIHPEYCNRTAKMLEDRFGTPYLRPKEGAPVGYPATRSFVREVADALGLDPSPALEYIDREAGSVHRILMNFDRIPVSLYAKGFTVKGDSSVALPLVKWMHSTFGMVPRHLETTDDEYTTEILEFLRNTGFEEAIEGSDREIDVVFTDGLTAADGRLSRTTVGYVEVCIPRGKIIDLMDRTLVGTKGCRYILDEMMNNITRFRCGQPTDIDYRPERSRTPSDT